MNLQQCEQYAQDNDQYDSLKFTAKFPAGIFTCKWIDAYFGILTIEGITDNGFIIREQLEKAYGYNIECVIIEEQNV